MKKSRAKKAVLVKPKAPDWATKPFDRLLSRTETLTRLMYLSTKGISILRAIPKLVDVLAKAKGEHGSKTHTARLEEAKKEAELAQREVDQGFPLLHNQAVILTWAFLEGTIKTFICEWIKNVPDVWCCD